MDRRNEVVRDGDAEEIKEAGDGYQRRVSEDGEGLGKKRGGMEFWRSARPLSNGVTSVVFIAV